MFIYVITNDINNRVYVGLHSGRDLQTRWTTHRSFARTGSRAPISAAIRKYGEKKFHIVSVWSGNVSFEHLKVLEKYFIRSFQARTPNGYNLTDGGDGTLGFRHSEDEKMRRAERMREQNASGNICASNRRWSADRRKKFIATRTGMKYKPWSEEARRNFSEARAKKRDANSSTH